MFGTDNKQKAAIVATHLSINVIYLLLKYPSPQKLHIDTKQNKYPNL